MSSKAKTSIEVADDLTISIAGAAVRISPSEGLRLAERLTRTSFRKALVEEAQAHGIGSKGGPR